VSNEKYRRHARQRNSPDRIQHNEPVIRGMGWYSSEGMISTAQLHMGDGDIDAVRHALIDFETTCAEAPGSFVWLGLFEPTKEELYSVAELLKLDELLVEDAANVGQRAKVDVAEDGSIFTLLKLLTYDSTTLDVETGQISIFIGSWFALTIRYGHLGDLSHIRARLERSAILREHGPFAVLYAIIDETVDSYLTLMEDIQSDVTEIETAVFAANPPADIARVIYNLKRENQEVRRAVTPLVPSAHQFVADQFRAIPAGMHDMFSDIGEHILRVSESVESVDQLLFTLLTASTSLQDFKQNRDMRKISAWAAIGVVPTAVAGIYGMNFDNMPELSLTYGYPASILVMVIICTNLYRAFKKSNWL